MHIISLALDPKVLDKESVVAFRTKAYGSIVDHYTVIVPSPSTMTVYLSDRATIYGIGGKWRVIQLFKMYRKVTTLIHEKKCNVITSQDMYFLGLLGLFFARKYHLGLEVQVLGIEKLTHLRKVLATFVLKRASVVRALSHRLEKRLISEFNIPSKKIRVVPIYVDVNKLGLDVRTLTGKDAEEFRGHSEKFRTLYGKRFNFLTVSRLVPIKRIEFQLRALRALIDENYNVLLHIVGAGPDETKLKQMVTELKLTEHVVFHGYQSGRTLGMFYIECDCFLLTSDYEGWGMVIVEALSAGLPIIMTDVGCAGELVIHEKSGLVVPPLNLEGITNAMKRIVKENNLRETVSVGGMHALATLPDFETVLKAYRENWEVALTHKV